MKKDITFADKAKSIKARYYKNRKPGEDSMTDEAFNREMKQLMMLQESMKQEQDNQKFAKGGKLNNYVEKNPYNDYLSNPGKPVDVDAVTYAKGGGLPKYDGTQPYSSYLNSWDNIYDFQNWYNKNSPESARIKTGGYWEEIPELGYDDSRYMGTLGPQTINAWNRHGEDYLNNNTNWNLNKINPITNIETNNSIPTIINKPRDLNVPNRTQNINTLLMKPITIEQEIGRQMANINPSQYIKTNGQSILESPSDLSFGNSSIKNNNFNYTPRANILGPALSIGTSAIASGILARNNNRRLNDLLKDVNFGRVNPQQIDLSRERANIKSNEALSEATGRYLSRGAKSASEASNIQNLARLNAQRTSGNLLGQSFQKEELTNAELRAIAEEQNRQLAAQEMQTKLGLRDRYGNNNSDIWSNFATTTGQSLAGYLAENQRMKKDYDFLRMMQPKLNLDFDVDPNADWRQRFLYNTGLKQPNRSITVRR